MIAFGEGADTVPETLRRIGDVSAGIQAPVNEIAELYGKARVQDDYLPKTSTSSPEEAFQSSVNWRSSSACPIPK
ncbi:MAG: hypothetical protein H7A51_04010 [Akkermansiaceae bacterium]|nr:hypothetical protein [Akkermansiaceae bacterium]